MIDIGRWIEKTSAVGISGTSRREKFRTVIRSTWMPISSRYAAVRVNGMVRQRVRQRSTTGEPVLVPG
jgi:hypothetical protein